MKEYKIIKAKNTDEAEKIMNDMAEQGWEVVCMTDWSVCSTGLLITFARNKQQM